MVAWAADLVAGLAQLVVGAAARSTGSKHRGLGAHGSGRDVKSLREAAQCLDVCLTARTLWDARSGYNPPTHHSYPLNHARMRGIDLVPSPQKLIHNVCLYGYVHNTYQCPQGQHLCKARAIRCPKRGLGAVGSSHVGWAYGLRKPQGDCCREGSHPDPSVHC